MTSPPARATIWLRLLLGGSVVLPLGFAALNTWQARSAALRQCDLQISTTTRLLSEQVQKVLETNQLAIALVDRMLGNSSWQDIAKSEPLRQQLRDLDASLEQVVSVMVVNRDDEVANSSHAVRWPPGLAPANHQWMAVLHDKPETVVTPIYTGKVTHEAQFSVGKRRSSPDGQYNGAIVISDRADYFRRLFDEVAPHDSRIALALDTGEVLISKPAISSPLSTDLLHEIQPDKPLLTSNVWPNFTGHAGLERVQGFPLIVMYAVDDVSGWYKDAIGNVVLALLGSSCVFLTCIIALRSHGREQEAAHQLHVEMNRRREVEGKMYQSLRMEALGQLTSGVAHDFNNLLTIIIGNAEQIARSADERIRGQASTMLTAANRGAHLVGQLLSFGRRQLLQVQPYDVCMGLQQFAEMIRTSLKPTVAIEYALGKNPLVCYLDRSEFELAILNIVRNADHAMPHGGRLTIRGEMVFRNDSELPPGRYTRLVFEDSGDGMPEDVRQRAFEPFFTTRELTAGSGLGLSHVYGFVKQTGGDVVLESEVGHGTKLILYLPMDEHKPMTDTKKLILVVDDEPGILDVIDPILAEEGYAIYCTTDPHAALRYAAENDVALLLTDIVMPSMSGLELAKQVTATKPQIKVLVMTGYSNLDGGYPLVRKPFRMASLVTLVRTVLGETQGRWTQ